MTDTLGHLLMHHLTAFYDWESIDKAMEGIGASQVIRLHYDVFKPAINMYLVIHLCYLYTILYLVVN